MHPVDLGNRLVKRLAAGEHLLNGGHELAAAVSVTPLLVRVNSGKPHSASTPDTAWLTAEGVMCSRSAAAAKVPSCATMLNSWQSVSVMSCISCSEKIHVMYEKV